MNTGNKNTYGRTIFKGPRGGTYVTHASGKKIYKFTKASAPVASPNGTAGYTKTKYEYSDSPVYKKNGTNEYYFYDSPSKKMFGMTRREFLSHRGVFMSLANHLAANRTPPAPRVATPPKHKGFTKTTYVLEGLFPVYVKTASGRYYYETSGGKLSVMTLDRPVKNSRNGVIKTLRAARAALPRSSPRAAPPISSPRRVLTNAERNARLAEIKVRLNAIRAARRANMPKTRKNVENRLRLAVRRVRERKSTADPTTGYGKIDVSIPICRSTTSVPRRACITKQVSIPVYESGPLINSGAIVAMKKGDFDIDWFKRQNKYISSLSDYDFWTVQAHTNRSHSWIGPYTRDGTISSMYGLGEWSTHITPLWPQIRKLILSGRGTVPGMTLEGANDSTSYTRITRIISSIPQGLKKDALDMYRADLKRIIANAPKSRKKMILYRGSGFDIFRGTRGHWHTLNAFCSAAFDGKHALGYGATGFQRITVLPGTSVLLVAGVNQWSSTGEYEIMVNIDTKYLIRARGVRRQVYFDRKRHSPMRVTDVTIAK